MIYVFDWCDQRSARGNASIITDEAADVPELIEWCDVHSIQSYTLHPRDQHGARYFTVNGLTKSQHMIAKLTWGGE